MGFPAILSTLQAFEICVFNRKKSKLTFSSGPYKKVRFSQISTMIPGGGLFHNFLLELMKDLP